MVAAGDLTRLMENDDGSLDKTERGKATVMHGAHEALSFDFDKMDENLKALIRAAPGPNDDVEGRAEVHTRFEVIFAGDTDTVVSP